MNGRYGMDELNRFLLIAAAVVLCVNIFLGWWILRFIGVVLLILVFSRAFSRTIYKRQEENAKYLNFKSRIFDRRRRKKDEGKRILICPYCKGKLKVPVGAGKIKIRCPHCKAEFEEIV